MNDWICVLAMYEGFHMDNVYIIFMLTLTVILNVKFFSCAQLSTVSLGNLHSANIRNCTDLKTFKGLLKTHLFNIAFNNAA